MPFLLLLVLVLLLWGGRLLLLQGCWRLLGRDWRAL